MAKFRFQLCSTLLAAPLLLGATSSVAAAADSNSVERHRAVEYSDLDLATQAGQSKFKARIMRAVRGVCALPSAKTAFERADQAACETKAKATAMKKAERTIARHGGSVKVALD